MSALAQRCQPIRSRKYIDGSRAQSCVLRIPNVCTGGGDDTIFAHIRDRHTGRGVRASDLSGADSCFACHDVFDRRAKLPNGEYLSDDDWRFYALRALQDTIERRHGQGLLVISQDVATPPQSRVTPPRKPKEHRAPIQNASSWRRQAPRSRDINEDIAHDDA